MSEQIQQHAAPGFDPMHQSLEETDVPKRVYVWLAAKHGYETWIHFADVGAAVIGAGINRKAYGFQKLNDFMQAVVEALDGAVEVRLAMIDEEHSKREALVHRVEEFASDVEELRQRMQEDEETGGRLDGGAPHGVVPPFDYAAAAQKAKLTIDYISGRISQEVLASLSPEFSRTALFPTSTRGYLMPFVPKGGDAVAMASAAWSAAVAEGAIRSHGDKLIFPLPVLRDDHVTPVEIVLAPNDRTPEVCPWFVQYIDSASRPSVPRGQSPSRALTDFAYLGRWDTFLEELAELALPEKWDFDDGSDASDEQGGRKSYPILMSYITNTFYRLQREGNIAISDDQRFAAFNSGLVTKRYDDIYVCFEPNAMVGRNPWRFTGFCTKGVGRLGKRLVNLFSPLPPTATFFKRKEDLLFDVDKDLIVNYDHVILDNMGRLPVEFLEEGLRTDDHALALLGELSRTSGSHREEIIDEVRSILEQDDTAFMYLRVRLNDAINRARKRVRWNYKTAIPMYYPRANTMSLLLPICLMDPSIADAALVVELMDSGNYQGQTILTMRMAYQDARLVCRPDSDWLTTTARSTDED